MFKQASNSSIVKHPVVLILIATVVILTAGIFLLSQNKIQNSSSSPRVLSQSEHESVVENPTYGHVHSLFRNPADSAFLMGTHNGLFKSTDEGKTFQKVEVKGDVKAMDFMNFAYDQTSKIIYAGGHDVGVVKSTDGITWTKTDSGITGTDIHALAINPLDPNRLYAFSVDNGVFGTEDGGKTWNRIDDGPTNPSVRAFGYMATPSSMDRGMKTDKTTNIGYLWAGTGGGLYSSFTCFCGWTKTEGIGGNNATIYTLAPDPINKSTMLIGTKDGIYKTTDEGKSFNLVNADIKDVTSIVFDQIDAESVFAITSGGILYKSDDSRNTWKNVN